MAYVTSGQVGIDLAATTAGTTTNGADAVFALGQLVTATDGSEWVYVQAGAAITQYSWLSIDENFQAVMGTTALAAAGHSVGFAQVAFADNEFGWVSVHAPGNLRVRALNSCAADVQLYTSGTAGVLDDTSAGGVNLIRGCVLVVAASNTAVGHREVIAVYPSGTATP